MSHFASLLFVLSITTLLSFPSTIRSDEPCPYPCYPPPIGGTTPTTPSVTPAPPQPVSSYPPPSGYYPYAPPPPYGGDFNGGSGMTPPPPDPILPYFPFYFRKPPHKTDESSEAPTLQRWTGTMIATTCFLTLTFLLV
ncbi:chitin-binding lectin 1-like [Neltuma alba]|uniref:chitin-binding lectin 1-like n=1 Tax=Neltuma alba TaxID=207710 RepID=UPI0010A339E3|nr:chitin-binding lectin 1-like [Prosopis alba]